MNNFQFGIASFDSDNTVIKFNDVFNNGTNYFSINDQTGNNGNISIDPSFVDESLRDFHLTDTSPCIDSGDTLTPNDPDSTRTDIGALYFNQIISSISDNRKIIENLIVYPNPTEGLINLSNNYPQIADNKKYTIHNNLGQIVESGELINTSLEIHSLQAGLYLLSIYSGNKVYFAKVIKK